MCRIKREQKRRLLLPDCPENIVTYKMYGFTLWSENDMQQHDRDAEGLEIVSSREDFGAPRFVVVVAAVRAG